MNPDNKFITVPGGSATYTCITSILTNDNIESVQWLVNNTLVENLELDNVVVTGLGRLRFTMTSEEYNNTNIRCRATFMSGSITTSETGSLLLIQG